MTTLRIWIVVGIVTGLAVGALIFFGTRTNRTTPAVTITQVGDETTRAAVTPPPHDDSLPHPDVSNTTNTARPKRKRGLPVQAKAQTTATTLPADSPPSLIGSAIAPAASTPVAQTVAEAPHTAASTPVAQTVVEAPHATATSSATSNHRRAVQETDMDSGPQPLLAAEPGARSQSQPSQSAAPQPAPPASPSALSTPQPSPPVTPPLTRAAPGKPAYNGPLSGTAVWTGKLGKNDTLTITDGTPSTGVLSGAGLPGVPVRLAIDQSNLGFAEMPNARNGYRRLVLRSHSKHDKITIHWNVVQ